MSLGEKLVLQTFWEKIKKYFATKLYVPTLKSSKQDTLIAGKGIRIVNNVISNSLFPYKYKNDQGQWVVQGSDEKVIVTLFGPSNLSLANRQITLTYYLDNEPVLPARVITKTTDSNGVVIFSSDPETGDGTGVPVGYEYEITFPKIANYLEITPEKHVAGVVERNIEVTYVGLPDISEDDYGEEITIHLDKFENNTVTPFEGINVSVKIGTAAATTYTTDANGNTISFKVRYGLSYTVTAPTMTDYYIPAAAYTLTYTSEKRHRDISFMYKFIRVGVFIVDKNGNEYTGEEWEEAKNSDLPVTSEDALLLKIVTSLLAAYNVIFGINIYEARTKMFLSIGSASPTSANGNIFYLLPNGTGVNCYNGLLNTRIMIKEINETALNFKSTLTNKYTDLKIKINENTNREMTLYGFIGSVFLWNALYANKNIIDSLLELVLPESEKPEGVTYYLLSLWPNSLYVTSNQNSLLSYFYIYRNGTNSAHDKDRTKTMTLPFYTI